MRNYPNTGSRLLATLMGSLLLAGLSGCVNTDTSDLEAYISEIKARPPGRIEPPPDFPPYQSYEYVAGDRRNPFAPFFKTKPTVSQGQIPGNGLQPDTCGTGRRNCEELENFPLDSLRMVGTLESDETRWGIVMSQNGDVYRVQVGNYIGQNFGKIVSISEDLIETREIIPDGRGGWEERTAGLGISE